MKKQDLLLDQVTAVVSEAMGDQTGKLFHTFYEFEDAEAVITGARSLLANFMGTAMAEKKLKTVSGKR